MAPAFDDRSLSRRSLLRASGATLATGLSSLGSGCTGLPPLGTQVRYGSVDVPEPGPPRYRNWLPEPSAFSGDVGDGYTLMTYAPPPSDAPAWARGGIARNLVAAWSDYVGVHVDDVDVAFATDAASGGDGAAVLLGDVDRPVVRQTIPDTPYEPVGSYAGYDVYERPDRDRAVAVGSEAVVFGNGQAPREALRATVDAGRGEATRYHEREENVAALTANVGTRRWGWLWPGGISSDSITSDLQTDTVGWATAFDHDDAGAYVVQTWVFPEGYDVTEGKVKGDLKGSGAGGLPSATEVTAVDVTVDGRVATVAMFMGPDVIREEYGGGAFVVPYVTWETDYDRDAERLTVRHTAGDPVRTDWLTVAAGDRSVPAAESGAVGARLEPGEALSVSTAALESGADVRFVYREPNGDRSAAVYTYELP